MDKSISFEIILTKVTRINGITVWFNKNLYPFIVGNNLCYEINCIMKWHLLTNKTCSENYFASMDYKSQTKE